VALALDFALFFGAVGEVEGGGSAVGGDDGCSTLAHAEISRGGLVGERTDEGTGGCDKEGSERYRERAEAVVSSARAHDRCGAYRDTDETTNSSALNSRTGTRSASFPSAHPYRTLTCNAPAPLLS
jgi:hypothetical protein